MYRIFRKYSDRENVFISWVPQKQMFLTNASTAMWGSSEPEGVDVCLDLLHICRKKERGSVVKTLIWLQTFGFLSSTFTNH